MNKIYNIFIAVDENHVEELRRITAAGADVHIKDQCGGTPLQWAAFKGHIVCILEFIGSGANPFLLDDSKKMAKDMANQRGHQECEEWIAILNG